MKFYKSIIFYLFAIMTAISVMTGCSLTHTLETAKIPQLQVGSPLKSVQPSIFAFNEFKGGGSKDDLIGDFGIHKYRLDQPPSVVVASAIKRELERNGHTCISESPLAKSDFIVEGYVYKYFLTMDSGFWHSYVNGDVATKLTISSTHNDKKEFVKNYEGKFRIQGLEGPAGVTEDVAKYVLLEMVKEFSRDTELIEFLQSNKNEVNSN